MLISLIRYTFEIKIANMKFCTLIFFVILSIPSGLLSQDIKTGTFDSYVILKTGDTIFTNDYVVVQNRDSYSWGYVKINGEKYRIKNVKFVNQENKIFYSGKGKRIYKVETRGKINTYREEEIVLHTSTHGSASGFQSSRTTSGYHYAFYIQKGDLGELVPYTYKNLLKMVEDNLEIKKMVEDLIDKHEKALKVVRIGIDRRLKIDYTPIYKYNKG